MDNSSSTTTTTTTTTTTGPTPTPPPPPRTTRKPHLLNIPGELRNQIYSHLLLSSGPLPIHRDRRPECDPTAAHPLSSLTPLLRTCRQVHAEAGALVYSHARFALPPNGSQAPRQAQTNLLFRAFLDRVGPRNAARVRHLVLPFPVDPAVFLERAYRRGYGDGEEEDEEEDEVGSLIPPLAARCPRLETVVFDLTGNNTWVRLVGMHVATVRRMFGAVDRRLRAAFPDLKGVEVWLSGPAGTWNATGQFYRRIGAEIRGREWEWVRAALEEGGKGGCGWRVTLSEDEVGGPHGYGMGDIFQEGWASTWYTHNPRRTIPFPYRPPDSLLRSEMHDQWTTLDFVLAYARFGIAWLRSPTKASMDREEALEWKRWRRRMLLQAAPVGARQNILRWLHQEESPSRKEGFKWGALSSLVSRLHS